MESKDFAMSDEDDNQTFYNKEFVNHCKYATFLTYSILILKSSLSNPTQKLLTG